MRLRTKSKASQWVLWLCAALAAMVLYVVLSDVLFESVSWNVLDPERYRLAFPLVAAFAFFAWETRWDRIVRTANRSDGSERPSRKDVASRPAKVEAEVAPQPKEPCVAMAVAPPGPSPSEAAWPAVAGAAEAVRAERHSHDDTDVTGEALYAKARSLPHRRIPDFKTDAYYLELLVGAARKGFSPAMAKLGDYAMRRMAWAEAYYWMTQARRNGMHNLSTVMREIRKRWALCGCPNELMSEAGVYSADAASVGSALLYLDAGRNISMVREFLQTHHPEYLTDGV